MPEVTYCELLRRQAIRAVSDSGANSHAARPKLEASLAAETVRTKRAAAAVCAIVTKQQGSAHQTAWDHSFHVSKNLVLQPRVQAALRAWGYGPDVVGIVQNTIVNNEVRRDHDEKYIVQLQGVGARLFIGAANRAWPASERVEERFAAVARAFYAFPDGVRGANTSTEVILVPPLRRPSGTFLFTDGLARRYLTAAFEGETLHNTDASSCIMLAYALGAYHRIMAAAGAPAAPQRWHDLNRNVQSYVSRLASQWQSAAAGLARVPRTGFDPARVDQLRNTSRALSKRSKRLGLLPRTWIHDDFQFKNILKLTGGRLAVIDMPDGSWAPRVFDLGFVIGLSISASPPPSEADERMDAAPSESTQFDALIAAYYHGGGAPLSTEEAELLPDALQVKFLGEAMFALNSLPSVAEFQARAQRASISERTSAQLRAAGRTAQRPACAADVVVTVIVGST